MNENSLTLSNKFDVALPVYSNLHLKTANFRRNYIKRIISTEIHFIVYCIQFVLNAVGLNVAFPATEYKYRNRHIVFKLLYYFWNIITAMQVVTFLSLVFTMPAHGSIKIFISHVLQRAFSLSNRMLLYTNRNKCKEILLEINTLKSLTTVKCKRIKYMLIITALYIHICTVISVYALLNSLTTEEIEIRNARNIFNIRFDHLSAEILLTFATSVWIYANVVVPSILAVTYEIFGSIIRNEFCQLLYEVNHCHNESDVRVIIEKYNTAIKIGKAFDDALGFPVFSALGFILISLFFNGYRLFVMNMTSTYQVIFMLFRYNSTSFCFCIIQTILNVFHLYIA